MTHEEARSNLIASLETLKQISDAQSKQLETARTAAQQVEDTFKRRMAGEKTEIPDSFFKPSNDPLEQAVRRETEFLKAFESLMVLYAHEPSRPTTQKIFDTLSQIRLIDVGADSPIPDYPAPDVNGTDRAALLKSFADFTSSISDLFNSRQDHFTAQIQKSETLLDQARSLAATL